MPHRVLFKEKIEKKTLSHSDTHTNSLARFYFRSCFLLKKKKKTISVSREQIKEKKKNNRETDRQKQVDVPLVAPHQRNEKTEIVNWEN